MNIFPLEHSAGAGFGRRLRLADGGMFAAVFDRRTRMHSPHFSAHVAPNGQGHPRLGLSVSRKVSRRAVQRNRIKRIIRESFRRHSHQLGATDYVVVAKSGAAGQDSPELSLELESLWFRAGRKCGSLR